MSGEYDGNVPVSIYLPDEIADGYLRDSIQTDGRFVEKQDGRLV
jgi:hypothetical protein